MRARTLILLALIACSRAFAQAGAYPERPVHLVVPFTPGGNADIVARILAQGLSEELKQSVVVENKPGANAAIGAEYVARAAPDGYLLLFATAETHALNPHLRKALAYDPLKDFASVGVVDNFALSLVVSPKLPAGDLAGFVAYARQYPGKLNFASWGNGSTSQIAFEQIKQATGIDLVHVPFQGAAPAITAVAAGSVEAFVVPLSVARPQASNGRVKLVAVTSARREDSAPEVPTATEQGVPVVISGWHILAAPTGTPPEIVARLNRALNAATARAEIRDKLLKAGVQPVTCTSEETQNMVKAEWQRWGDVARKAGIMPN
ncbi:MAG: tripartite tricarboxylate transporter substrate binding protein [Betaproteobacteria bacterium]|nr:tripartite tricarboxylate transporter substrate binding protein [Betaproteobacteria bacterium]